MNYKLLQLNEVEVVGNLLNAPRYKMIRENQPICTFTIACNKKYRNFQGEIKDKLAIVPVVAWSHLANDCRNLKKGDAVYIDGELHNKLFTINEEPEPPQTLTGNCLLTIGKEKKA